MASRYLLTGQLEAGELAELYAAMRDDDQPVEIKLFHPQTTDVRYAQELAETARLLGSLPAPGISHFLELGLVEGRLAVVRERAEGPSLGAALQRLATKEVLLPFQVALALMIELAETVQQAHDVGVIHGAITPGNVTVTPEGHAVLGDFGALRALQAAPALKKVFAARGRNTYRAPELGVGDAPSEQSDIYSLGAIAYELLTLREPVPPGGGGNLSTRREPLPPPSRVDRRLNGRIDPLVMRAMDPLPTRRFRSCGELSTALRNFLSNNGGMPLREDVQRVVRELTPRQPQLGPVPFSEPFSLTEVDGAELPELDERSRVISMRPAFSGAEPPPAEDAETQEAAPAFEEYQPDPDTNPSKAGPLEQGWEAPPGIAPPRPRRALTMAGQLAAGRRPAARNPRLKVIEDYSVVAPAPAQNPFAEEDITDRVQQNRPPRSEAPPRGPAPRPAPPPPALPPAPNTINESAPRESGEQEVPVQAPDKVETGEDEPLARTLRRRRRLSQIGLILAFIAACCFGLAVLRVRSGQPNDPASRSLDPDEDDELKRLQAVHPPVPVSGPTPAPQPGPPEPQPPPPAQSAPTRAVRGDPPADEPPARRDAAFLTVFSDVPASVSIDGMKVRKRTPLIRYPVEPGERDIVIETLSTHERHQFKLGFEKGKLRRVEEKFRRAGR